MQSMHKAAKQLIALLTAAEDSHMTPPDVKLQTASAMGTYILKAVPPAHGVAGLLSAHA